MDGNNILRDFFENLIKNIKIKLNTDISFTPLQISEIINDSDESNYGGFFNSITNITSGGLSSIKKIFIKEGVTELSERAFNNLENLEIVYLPESLKNIYPHCFSGCKKLKNINFPPNITYVGTNALFDTAWLNDQPNNELIYIGNALYGYKGNLSETLLIKDGVVSVTQSSFIGNKMIKKITAPSSLKILYISCFQNCSNLEEVELQGTGIRLGRSVFFENSNLKKCLINDVESIDMYAFSGCTAMEELYFLNSNNLPNSLYSNAFLNMNPNAKIFVRESLFNDWKSFLINRGINENQIQIYNE